MNLSTSVNSSMWSQNLGRGDDTHGNFVSSSSKKTSSAARSVFSRIRDAKDGAGNKIATASDFKWGFRNPLATVFKWDNNYVTEQWSAEYILACKEDVGLLKNSVIHAGKSIGNGRGRDAAAHAANALAVGVLLGVNIELANFVKGLFGALISSGKAGVHALAAVLKVLIGFFVCLGNRQEGTKLMRDGLNDLGLFVKDLMSIISCVGHMIPSWLPLVVMLICPPAGLILAGVKLASKLTGIFDLMAYGGTAALLYANTKCGEKREKSKADWDNLKKELNPNKSFEGATLALFGLHVLLEGVAGAVDFFAPGVGTAAKYAMYGIMGAAAVGLYGNLLRQKQAEKGKEHAGDTLPDTDRSSWLPPGLSEEALQANQLAHMDSDVATELRAAGWAPTTPPDQPPALDTSGSS